MRRRTCSDSAVPSLSVVRLDEPIVASAILVAGPAIAGAPVHSGCSGSGSSASARAASSASVMFSATRGGGRCPRRVLAAAFEVRDPGRVKRGAVRELFLAESLLEAELAEGGAQPELGFGAPATVCTLSTTNPARRAMTRTRVVIARCERHMCRGCRGAQVVVGSGNEDGPAAFLSSDDTSAIFVQWTRTATMSPGRCRQPRSRDVRREAELFSTSPAPGQLQQQKGPFTGTVVTTASGS